MSRSNIELLGKVLIEMPPEHYDPFVEKCDRKSRDYSTLKNGMLIKNPDTGEKLVVAILCDKAEAVKLLSTATHLYPKAAAAIKAAIDR